MDYDLPGDRPKFRKFFSTIITPSKEEVIPPLDAEDLIRRLNNVVPRADDEDAHYEIALRRARGWRASIIAMGVPPSRDVREFSPSLSAIDIFHPQERLEAMDTERQYWLTEHWLWEQISEEREENFERDKSKGLIPADSVLPKLADLGTYEQLLEYKAKLELKVELYTRMDRDDKLVVITERLEALEPQMQSLKRETGGDAELQNGKVANDKAIRSTEDHGHQQQLSHESHKAGTTSPTLPTASPPAHNAASEPLSHRSQPASENRATPADGAELEPRHTERGPDVQRSFRQSTPDLSAVPRTKTPAATRSPPPSRAEAALSSVPSIDEQLVAAPQSGATTYSLAKVAVDGDRGGSDLPKTGRKVQSRKRKHTVTSSDEAQPQKFHATADGGRKPPRRSERIAKLGEVRYVDL